MKDKRYILEIQQSNSAIVTIDCTDKENILEALVRQNLQYRFDCGGRGICGKCKVQVLKGELDITLQDRKLFSEEELQMGYRLSCKAYPKEAVTIKLLSESESDMDVIVESRSISKDKAIKDKIIKDKNNKDKNNKDIKDKAIKDKIIKDKNNKDKNNKDIKDKNIKDKNIKDINDAAIKTDNPFIKDDFVIGIDLGTTTLAVSLVDITTGSTIRTYTATNPQRAYGADVISRIKTSNEGKRDYLRDMIRKSLKEGILSVVRESGIEIRSIKKIAIAGNTTMGHLLMGYSCETLGVFPFTLVNIGIVEMKYKDIFKIDLQIEKNSLFDFQEEYLLHEEELMQEVPVIVLPGISTFVGGDIVAGLSICGFNTAKKPCLLIDLGTNGEMALGNREHILVTSTAAGPAFEGGNISCGVGSIPGAISHMSIHGDEVTYETIGDKSPIGICGTGVVEIASELLKAGFMDETGLLVEEYFDEGFPIIYQSEISKASMNHLGVVLQQTNDNPSNNTSNNLCNDPTDNPSNKLLFTQKDIRELQLAKAAIRAGVETLIKSYGTTFEQIEKVYLAGGFGYRIDVEKAIHIGLLPEGLRDKIIVVGNSSLAGAVQYLTETDTSDKIEHILSISKEIHLSNDEDFNELYLRYMSF